jgi:RNA polymerase sigma-70 factor (ECF subfamily)
VAEETQTLTLARVGDEVAFRTLTEPYAEIATMLETTEASANSALQRARATLNAQMPPDRDRAPFPRSAREHEVVSAFADAIQNDDVDSVVSLLTDDALISRPPQTLKWQGREACRALALAEREHRPGKLWLVPTRANVQPAFGYYVQDPHTPIAHCHGLLVLTLRSSRISAITLFDTATLAWFGLPRTLEM